MAPPVKPDTLKRLLDSADEAFDKSDNVMILGDFNLGFINWTKSNDGLNLPSNYNTTLGHQLIDFLTFNNLKQLNGIENCNG